MLLCGVHSSPLCVTSFAMFVLEQCFILFTIWRGECLFNWDPRKNYYYTEQNEQGSNTSCDIKHLPVRVVQSVTH